MAQAASVNSVFYATTYHPIQAGSIDGTDTSAHDNAVYRALLATSTGLYDATGDQKAQGDPYRTLFVGRLSPSTSEKTLKEAMSQYGRVESLRLVRHIVTGASQGYAFVEFESDKDFMYAYERANHTLLDGSPILVDYNRQQLMPGWIPRRLGRTDVESSPGGKRQMLATVVYAIFHALGLYVCYVCDEGGGLGGRKESGQLRFGGRDRPFRAPLRPIPEEQLIKLGIPLPPVGRYMSRFQLPVPPQRSESYAEGRSRKHKLSHSQSLPHRVLCSDSLATPESEDVTVDRVRLIERGTESSRDRSREFGNNKGRHSTKRRSSDVDESSDKEHWRHKDRKHKERGTRRQPSPSQIEHGHHDRYVADVKGDPIHHKKLSRSRHEDGEHGHHDRYSYPDTEDNDHYKKLRRYSDEQGEISVGQSKSSKHHKESKRSKRSKE